MKLSTVFKEFFESEKAGGFVLIFSAAVALLLTNNGAAGWMQHLIHTRLNLSFASVHLDLTFLHWVNDGLMAIFFLLVGLEIKRELYEGELATFNNAVLPFCAAVGGMIVPAAIHYFLNRGMASESGFGIPMATDIAFALGVLSLGGKSVPPSLKVFLAAFAIIDDLGAIVVIALFYSKALAMKYLLLALALFAGMIIMSALKFRFIFLYLLLGLFMWYAMLQSGIHATIAGILLAFALPFGRSVDHRNSPTLQHFLHKPVAFLILPLFAFVNTAIVLPSSIGQAVFTSNSLGIIAGLVIGKFAGITLTCFLTIRLGIGKLPAKMNRRHLIGAALLGGIGFTMSIFITNLAFTDDLIIINSKISILIASIIAAITGLLVLSGRKNNEIPVSGRES